MRDGFWTVLVDEALCVGRFEKYADAERAATQLADRHRSRPHRLRSRPIRLHISLTSMQTERSTR